MTIDRPLILYVVPARYDSPRTSEEIITPINTELTPTRPDHACGTGRGAAAHTEYDGIGVDLLESLERVRAILAAQRKEQEQ